MGMDNSNESQNVGDAHIEFECPACGNKECKRDTSETGCVYLVCTNCDFDCVE